MFLGHDLAFWLSVAMATLIKVATSERHRFVLTAISVAAAVFSAWAFTDAALDLLALKPATYQVPVAALLALTGEGIIRWLIKVSKDPAQIVDLLKAWKGK